MNSKEKVRGNVSSEVGPRASETRTLEQAIWSSCEACVFLSRRHARVLIHETEPTADDTHGHLYHMCSRSDAKEEKNTRRICFGSSCSLGKSVSAQPPHNLYMGVSENRGTLWGTLFWGPYNKDPTI